MMRKNYCLLVAMLVVGMSQVQAQGLPKEMYLSPDMRQLFTGGQPDNGLYNQSQIKQVYLTLPANFHTLMMANYQNKIDIPGTMVVDGQTYDSVGVRYKGQTSYSMVNGQKKSININMDRWKAGQDLDGYNIINLNNCFDDPSFMREYFYLNQIRKHVPAAKCAYVHLWINGLNRGLYPNVQQLNKDYVKQWFMSNNGTLWRADKPPGGGGGGGGMWGDGTAALNYHNDTATYKLYYTLKSTNYTQPWADLKNACARLNQPSLAQLPTMLPDSMDVDRALWFLASEIAFSDDDSYVFKGKMDYYCYLESETHRLTPLEFDGNSVMHTSALNWSAFYNQTKINYPLMNRLFAVPEYRQRYLAHLRTIITEELDTASCNAFINNNKLLVDSIVLNDPIKIYTYANFNSEVIALKTWINNRRNFLLGNVEVNQVAPAISNVSFATNGSQWAYPTPSDSVTINATVTSTNGINGVKLFWAASIVGNFATVTMYDDGQHGDGTSGDGIYGGYIPAQGYSQWVRYYVEAKANDTYLTTAYSPVGAEHDVYVYFVTPGMASDTSVVINEVMASNQWAAQDNFGEFDDWIELYNKSSQPVDLSGYFLTDDTLQLEKYQLPQGTILNPNNYLIVWADENGSQGPLHANFKLSSSGERVWLLNPNREVVDKVEYGQQVTDQGYARVPNGYGAFVIQQHTFGYNNNLFTAMNEVSSASVVNVFPNPATDVINIVTNNDNATPITIVNAIGQQIMTLRGQTNYYVNTAMWQNGVYLVRYADDAVRLVVSH